MPDLFLPMTLGSTFMGCAAALYMCNSIENNIKKVGILTRPRDERIAAYEHAHKEALAFQSFMSANSRLWHGPPDCYGDGTMPSRAEYNV